MKIPKLIVLFFVFALAFQSKSQVVFCPPGAVWTACYKSSIFSQNMFSSGAIYVGDSIIGNDTVKILSHSKFYHQCNGSTQTISLIHQKGDTVFMKSKFTSNTWQILFNYACTAGQSWTTNYVVIPAPGTMRTLTVTVDSTDTFVENSFLLKRLFVSCTNSYPSATYPSTICERYGWGYPFSYLGRTNGCDGDFAYGTMYYIDQGFGTKSYNNTFCNPPNNVPEIEIERSITFYPNPFSDNLNLTNKNSTLKSPIEIYDQLGRRVRVEEITAGQTVNLSELSDGMYFLRYDLGNGWQTEKLVKSSNEK